MPRILGWILRLAAAGILLQTLFFKFTGAEESVYIFSTLGAEPWGRYLSGIMELVASLFLLYSRTVWLGALIAMGIMAGAIMSHLFVLGIEVMGDGGLLFGLGIGVFVMSGILLWMHRKEVPVLKQWLATEAVH